MLNVNREKRKVLHELCILCGAPTAVLRDAPVEERPYYIDGAGQLCPECYKEIQETLFK